MDELTKEDLIDQIKFLISHNSDPVYINPDYLQYFELEELQNIKNDLQYKRDNNKDNMEDILGDIYDKCT